MNIYLHLNQAIFSPADLRLSYSSVVLGYLQQYIATNIINPPVHNAAFVLPVAKYVNATVVDIVAIIKYLSFIGNTFFSLQLVRNGPNSLWLYNQACIRSLLLAKQYAAITIKILQGNPGSITPKYAMPSNMNPQPAQNIFLMFIDRPFVQYIW